MIEESIHGQLSLNRCGAAFLLGFDRQCLKLSAGRSFPIDVGWNFTALTTLERLHNILDGIFIEVRQKEMDIVQNIIHLNVHLHRGPHHAPKKLRNIGRIAGMLKGHHRFRTGTVPTCRQIFFKEHDANISIIGDTRRLFIANIEAVHLNGRGGLAKSMYYLTGLEFEAGSFLNFSKAIIQIGVSQFTSATIQNLDNHDWVDIGIVLLKAVLRPVLPLLFPVISGCLENRHIIVYGVFLRIGDDNPIFQKARCPHFIRCNDGFVNCGRRTFNQRIKTLCRSRHTNDNWHRRNLVCIAAFDKFLHDGRSLTGIASLHATMRFINDEIESITLMTHGIRQGLPNSISTAITIFRQLRGCGELLCVQEIDVTVLKHLFVEGIFADCNALAQANFVSLGVNLQLRLLIQLWRIRQPDNNGVRLLCVVLVSKENAFNQRGHNDGLACTGRRSKRDHLRSVCPVVAAHSLRCFHTDISEGPFLKWK